jgi:hypothetical protein
MLPVQIRFLQLAVAQREKNMTIETHRKRILFLLKGGIFSHSLFS